MYYTVKPACTLRTYVITRLGIVVSECLIRAKQAWESRVVSVYRPPRLFSPATRVCYPAREAWVDVTINILINERRVVWPAKPGPDHSLAKYY